MLNVKKSDPQSIERHDLLILSGQGREYARENRERPLQYPEGCVPAEESLWAAYPKIPAIFTGRRDPDHPSLLRVGFSYPVRTDGMRLRIASYVPESTVLKVITPWDLIRQARGSTGIGVCETVAGLSGKTGDLLGILAEAAEELSLKIGVFGSCALALATGLPYLHDSSDLDLVLDCASLDAVQAFSEKVAEGERMLGLRADIELRLDPETYIKLKEWNSKQTTVLAKGGDEPRLLSRRAVLERMRTAEDKNLNQL